MSTTHAVPPDPTLPSLPPDTIVLARVSLDIAKTWYSPTPPAIPQRLRHLLETYSKIPHNEVEKHLITIQQKAFAIHPYPCIGRWHWLRLGLPDFPQWPQVLELVKNGGIFLDVGAFLAAELRTLSSSPGVDPKNLYALELLSEFLSLGFECFNDGDRLPKDHFIAADFFSDFDSRLEALKGTVSVIHTGAFLHLFPWDKCARAVKRMIELSKSEPGSMVLGRVLGRREAAHVCHEGMPNSLMYRHNEESMKKMWKEVGESTGTKWEVWTNMRDVPLEPEQTRRDVWMGEGAVVVRFCARRV